MFDAFKYCATATASCRSKLCEELGWESFPDRRWCMRILQIHKIVSDKTPSYLKNQCPRLCRPLYKQSNSNTYHDLKCKSLRYTSSFFPDVITSWNNVITHFNDIPSFSVPKNHILSLIRPKKKMYFGIHLGLRYLFQLRVGLNSLRYHQNVITSLIPLLTNVVVTRVLKILIGLFGLYLKIRYKCTTSTKIKEQLKS